MKNYCVILLLNILLSNILMGQKTTITGSKIMGSAIGDNNIVNNNYYTVIYSDKSSKSPISDDSSYKGYGAYFYLRLKPSTQNEREFIVDNGKDLEKNRISLYLDKGNNLVYRIIDNEGESHIIKVLRDKAFQFDKFYFIYFDYGYSDSFSFMRLFVDTNKVGEIIFKYPTQEVDVPKKLDLENQAMFCDLNKQGLSDATILIFAATNVAFSKKQLRNLMQSSQFLLWDNATEKYEKPEKEITVNQEIEIVSEIESLRKKNNWIDTVDVYPTVNTNSAKFASQLTHDLAYKYKFIVALEPSSFNDIKEGYKVSFDGNHIKIVIGDL